MRSSDADLRRRVDRGLDLLQVRFGTPEPDRRLRPLDELISDHCLLDMPMDNRNILLQYHQR